MQRTGPPDPQAGGLFFCKIPEKIAQATLTGFGEPLCYAPLKRNSAPFFRVIRSDLTVAVRLNDKQFERLASES
jgi:hypothetical protein